MWPFKRKQKTPEEIVAATNDFSFLKCDFHNHLIPGIDDGAPTLEDSLQLITRFKDAGYSKLIMTPHIHGDYYRNNSSIIRAQFEVLREYVELHKIDVELGVAAEYNLDLYFQNHVMATDQLLTFGNNNILVEVSFAGLPSNFNDLLFTLQSKGYNPILAHPERYEYLTEPHFYHKLKENGIQLQLNILSIIGYYGPTVKHLAEKLLAEKLYDYCASDAHHNNHLNAMYKIKDELAAKMNILYNYGFKNNIFC